MYKLSPLAWNETKYSSVIDLNRMCAIPFDNANSDFAKFKKEIQGIGFENTTIEPVELQDAEGNTMTTEEVTEFIATLP
jgi:hypothetical protein